MRTNLIFKSGGPYLRLLLFIVPIYLCGFASHPASPSFLSDCRSLKTGIEANYFSYDQDTHLRLLKTANNLVEKYPSSWRPLYYSGMQYLLLGNIIRACDKKDAFDYYIKAKNRFEKIMMKHPSDEIQTLLSFTYGKLASLQTFKMIYFGYKSKSHMIAAFDKYPANPKRYMVAAIHLMYTPKFFGGSKNTSQKLIDQALELNKQWMPSDDLLVRWATDTEIKAHLAQLEILNDNHAQALVVVQDVLRHQPDYGFIKRDVIPQLMLRKTKALQALQTDTIISNSSCPVR